MKFFNSRTPREQLLIALMLVLVVLFAIWQFLINPMIEAKANADAKRTKALNELSIVQRAVPQLRTSESTTQTFDQAAVFNTARNVNIAISRIQPQDDNALKIWIEDTPSTTLYGFLLALSRDYAVDITRVNINRRDNGLVSAQITLGPST